MKLTVCQLDDRTYASGWEQLVRHVRTEKSDLVLLPEMPFCSWFASTDRVDPAVWQAAVDDHERWLARFQELAPAVVLGTRPVTAAGRRLNQGFVWQPGSEHRDIHAKTYLPDEEGFWEATWYERGDKAFSTFQAGPLRAGFLICTELWFMQHARAYGQQGAHLIAAPRSTMKASVEKWLTAGRTAAIISGAFCISSNRAGSQGQALQFGGCGWIIGPDGQVLGTTSDAAPFLTLDVDWTEAERAKKTYPRYVLE